MIPLSKTVHKLLLTIGVMALLVTGAYAAESGEIAYNAAVSSDSAQLLSGPSALAAPLVDIPANDTVVLLSDTEENGFYAASYQGEEEAYTGYIASDCVELRSVGTAAVLPEIADLRAEPDGESESIRRLYQEEELSLLGYEEGWFYVKAGSETGYLPLSDVNCVMTTTGRVNFRSEPNSDSQSLDRLSEGVILFPETSDGEWVKVTYDGQTGFVSTDYLEAYAPCTVEDPYRSGESVVRFAAQYLGNRYVWGGTSLEKGCDCSGYVMRVYEQFGVELPHSSRAMRNHGEEVEFEDIQVGDVVCYSGHVGIYAGDGMIINAYNSQYGICYTDVNYSTIITIRRLL